MILRNVQARRLILVCCLAVAVFIANDSLQAKAARPDFSTSRQLTGAPHSSLSIDHVRGIVQSTSTNALIIAPARFIRARGQNIVTTSEQTTRLDIQPFTRIAVPGMPHATVRAIQLGSLINAVLIAGPHGTTTQMITVVKFGPVHIPAP